MKSWYTITNSATAPAAEILIYEEIGIWGITAKNFAADLKAIPADRAINLRINSPGGSVFDGFAIHNLLRARGDKVTAHIDGIAASIATVIALGAHKVIAAENALWMIHNVTSGAWGDSDDLRREAEVIDKLRDQVVSIYEAATGKPRDEIIAAMDEETWFTADEAEEWGFVDEVAAPVEAAACARHASYNFAKPPPVGASQATPGSTPAPTSADDAPASVGILRRALAPIAAALGLSAHQPERGAPPPPISEDHKHMTSLIASLKTKYASDKKRLDRALALLADEADLSKTTVDGIEAKLDAEDRAAEQKELADLRAENTRLQAQVAALTTERDDYKTKFEAVKTSGAAPVDLGAPAGAAAHTGENPWVTGNLTEQIKLAKKDPELAKTLEAAAKAAAK